MIRRLVEDTFDAVNILGGQVCDFIDLAWSRTKFSKKFLTLSVICVTVLFVLLF